MKIKWKAHSKFRPDIILSKLESSKKVTEGKVSFDSFEKIENEVVIASMLDFGESVSPYEKSILVSKALFSCAKTTINKDNFLSSINDELKTFRVGNLREFRLLTTLSLEPNAMLQTFRLEGCTIRFMKGAFPKKYSGRSKLLEYKKTEDTNENHVHVIVSTKANSAHKAAEKCMDALNLLRSFLCFQLNNSLTISFGSSDHKPVNKVNLGKFQTIHTSKGSLATEVYWYVPNHTNLKTHKIRAEHEKIVAGNIKWFIAQFLELNPSDRRRIKNALLRFVNAFDSADYHAALIMGWGSLESLVSNEKNSNNDLISRRCSFVFLDRKLHAQIIEHIREYRNRNVHYGESSDDPSIICYQLQRYFFHLVKFYLSFASEFKNLDEANVFLDLPEAISDLQRRTEIIEKAINYLSPKNSLI